jgi:cell division protein FtsL
MSRSNSLALLLLLLTVVASGVAVVFVKHQSRVLFVELQSMRANYEVAMMEWKNQQLELATVGNLDEILRKAQDELGMHVPQTSHVVVIN